MRSKHFLLDLILTLSWCLFIGFGLCAGSIDNLSLAGDACTEEAGNEGQLTPKNLAGDVSLESLHDDLPLSDSSVLVDNFISTFSPARRMAFFPFWLWGQLWRVGQLWFYGHEMNKLEKTVTKTNKKDTKMVSTNTNVFFFYLRGRGKKCQKQTRIRNM